jgi:hypothetical protein
MHDDFKNSEVILQNEIDTDVGRARFYTTADTEYIVEFGGIDVVRRAE